MAELARGTPVLAASSAIVSRRLVAVPGAAFQLRLAARSALRLVKNSDDGAPALMSGRPVVGA